MDQKQRRLWLIRTLIAERKDIDKVVIPTDTAEQKQMLRALFNTRKPGPVSEEFLKIQDEYLQTALAEKKITDVDDLTPAEPGIYLWQGDITTLRCGAIVNAANSGLTGCYIPGHACIDNTIHTYAGVQLRYLCAQIMEEQGIEEPAGRAKLTPAFNLPADYVIHTVGPMINCPLTSEHFGLLESCYRSCLNLAGLAGIKSIAFCCISTGLFAFPNDEAAEIAVQTVRQFRAEPGHDIKVVFNVFKNIDLEIYRKLLGKHPKTEQPSA